MSNLYQTAINPTVENPMSIKSTTQNVWQEGKIQQQMFILISWSNYFPLLFILFNLVLQNTRLENNFCILSFSCVMSWSIGMVLQPNLSIVVLCGRWMNKTNQGSRSGFRTGFCIWNCSPSCIHDYKPIFY